MEEKIYKITLGDGTEISNLKLNGNNFISTEKIEESVFADNCSPVTISDGTTETVHPNMELVQIVEQIPGEYWFVLGDISEEEFARTKMQSDIAYIAMMSNVELSLVLSLESVHPSTTRLLIKKNNESVMED